MAKNNGTQSKTLEIKKYPNRRFYDSTRSKHVTLEEIHSLIKDGYEVRIKASKTREDITAPVLAQIILDLDPPKLEIFSVPMLHGLIRANEEMVNEFVEKYLNQALMAFFESQKAFDSYLRHTLGLSPTESPLTQWPRMMFGPFGGPFWGGEMSHEPSGAKSQPASAQETNDLREKMSQLEEQLATLQATLAKGGVAEPPTN